MSGLPYHVTKGAREKFIHNALALLKEGAFREGEIRLEDDTIIFKMENVICNGHPIGDYEVEMMPTERSGNHYRCNRQAAWRLDEKGQRIIDRETCHPHVYGGVSYGAPTICWINGESMLSLINRGDVLGAAEHLIAFFNRKGAYTGQIEYARFLEKYVKEHPIQCMTCGVQESSRKINGWFNCRECGTLCCNQCVEACTHPCYAHPNKKYCCPKCHYCAFCCGTHRPAPKPQRESVK